MPRQGLSRAKVLDAAVTLGNERGLEALSLKGVAEILKVKPPSLYNHVTSLEDLQYALTLRGLTALSQVLQRATVGVAGKPALYALARAYRRFATESPSLFWATLRTVEDRDEEVKRAGYEVLSLMQTVLAGFGLHGDDALHAARALRASLGGFVLLELSSGFGVALSVEESFERLLHLLAEGFSS